MQLSLALVKHDRSGHVKCWSPRRRDNLKTETGVLLDAFWALYTFRPMRNQQSVLYRFHLNAGITLNSTSQHIPTWWSGRRLKCGNNCRAGSSGYRAESSILSVVRILSSREWISRSNTQLKRVDFSFEYSAQESGFLVRILSSRELISSQICTVSCLIRETFSFRKVAKSFSFSLYKLFDLVGTESNGHYHADLLSSNLSSMIIETCLSRERA